MNELNKLSNSFNNTLKDSDLQNVTIDIAETFSDSMLNDGLLKDVPIIGSIIGLTKTAIRINDRLFLKKLIHFLTEINDINPESRKKTIKKIEDSEKYKIKVGEKLLYIIDKCEDHITAKYVAKLFSGVLREEMSYSDFLRASSIIQKVFVEDLEHFLQIDPIEFQRKITKYDNGVSDFENNLINVGICVLNSDEITVRDQDERGQSERYIVEGGNSHIDITEIGFVIFEFLS